MLRRPIFRHRFVFKEGVFTTKGAILPARSLLVSGQSFHSFLVDVCGRSETPAGVGAHMDPQMDCCKAPSTSNISSEISHSCDHFCSAVESGPCCKKGTGVTAVAEAVVSVGAAKNDDIDQALDCTLDFYHMEMYAQSCISVLSCVQLF